MRKRPGADLICHWHGVQFALIQETAPKSRWPFKVVCKAYVRGRQKRCSHRRDATNRQACEILKAHPTCDAKEYQPSVWDMFITRAPVK